ncbi:MAG: cell wall-binding repeat-containing protein [Actinomycetaceae bacterium]|nr:cell wall-binding repeat-containing protein [Actinomycetaceae bacterium]
MKLKKIAAFVAALALMGVSLTANAATSRVAGNDRFETAAAISAKYWPGQARQVFIASGLNFPDAMSLGPVAAAAQSPILLVNNTIPPSTRAELLRMKPAKLYMAGGPAAIPLAVEAELNMLLPGVSIERASGKDRHATSAAVAELGLRLQAQGVARFADGGKGIVLAPAEDFWMVQGPSAYAASVGFTLVTTAQDHLSFEVKAFIERHKPGSIHALGSEHIMSDAAVWSAFLAAGFKNNDSQACATGERPFENGCDNIFRNALYDQDAYEFSYMQMMSPLQTAVWVNDQDYPDALAATPLVTKLWKEGTVLLLPANTHCTTTRNWADGDWPMFTQPGVIIGGPNAIAEGALLRGCVS